MAQRTCTIDGCDNPHRARGLCATHYNQQHHPHRHTKVTTPCAGCGAPVEKERRNDRDPVCSYRCRSYVRYGRWPENGKDLVGPVQRRVMRPAAPRPTLRFVSVKCRWCGTHFTHDMRLTGTVSVWCSRRCARKAGKVKRRAQAVGAGGTYTWTEVVRLYLSIGGCAYCGQRVPTSDLEPDHVVPLSRGGRNSITNVVPCCRDCNRSKGAYLLDEWFKLREQRGQSARALNANLAHLT